MADIDYKQLFVGNLPFSLTKEDLVEKCSAFGVTDEQIKWVVDRETKRPRGFVFISFETEEDAKRAKDGLEGMEIDKRPLTVKFSEKRERTGGGDRKSFGGERKSFGGNGGGRSWDR